VSLSSDGTIVAIGGYGNVDDVNDLVDLSKGHVRVYEYDSSSGWLQVGDDIDGEAGGDWSGNALSLSADGTRVAIGAQKAKDGNGYWAQHKGHVRVYEYDSSSLSWKQLGDDIDGEADSDRSGRSVSLSADGTVVAIGAPDNNDNGMWAGHVRVYAYHSP